MWSTVFTHPVQIYYEDTDHSGVVYHPNFLKYFERAREHVIDSDRLSTLWKEKGLVFAVYKANLTFQEGVEFADVCEIRTKYRLDGKFKSIWQQELWRPNGKRAAVIGEIEMICLDANKQLQPIPEEALNAV